MPSIELLPHLLRRIQLSISQKKQMRADAGRTKLHEKELDQRDRDHKLDKKVIARRYDSKMALKTKEMNTTVIELKVLEKRLPFLLYIYNLLTFFHYSILIDVEGIRSEGAH
jgi:ribosomal protein S4